MTSFEIAQVNISRLKFALDSPEMAGFVGNLDAVNLSAETADGFRWRLKAEVDPVSGEVGDATTIPVYEDPELIVNMSVWRDVESLTTWMYEARHRAVLTRRREWFDREPEPMTALWWVPAGHAPSVREAEERLTHLRVHGPTAHAFTLTKRFDPPAPADAAH
ncbi:DUF3291 domain-containing protein [Streptomyces sp. BI20]|uniref:DUF3291 domain-containing protein n=1 Tax=Streptomyces sp. BI20 TaxID=3403460 RepID=UPI003C760D3B